MLISAGLISAGLEQGFLSEAQVTSLVAEFLAGMNLEGRRVVVLIPDGTRTMPMPLLFDILERELGARCKVLDFLVALGTHSPMSDAELSVLVGRKVVHGRTGDCHVLNHSWDRHETFVQLGTIPAAEIESLTSGLMKRDVAVSLNRMILDYDHILICGPVFPHEVAGFSGGVKYFFPRYRRSGDHPLHTLAGRAAHQRGHHRHSRYGGAARDEPCGRISGPAAFADRSRGYRGRDRRRVLRTNAGGVDGGS